MSGRSASATDDMQSFTMRVYKHHKREARKVLDYALSVGTRI